MCVVDFGVGFCEFCVVVVCIELYEYVVGFYVLVVGYEDFVDEVVDFWCEYGYVVVDVCVVGVFLEV